MEKIEFICNGWKEFEDEILPESAIKFMNSLSPGRQNWNWCYAYYLGENPNEAIEWIIVTDDGWYYKVDAEFMIWSKKYQLAIWSVKHLFKVITSIMNNEKPERDPDYQT